MDSYGIFHADTYLLSPKSVFWTPNRIIFVKNHDFPKNIPDFPETVPTYLNFATAHIFFVYPKKLSYSSCNAYIKKIRVRELGKPTCLLKNLKNAYKLTSFFL